MGVIVGVAVIATMVSFGLGLQRKPADEEFDSQMFFERSLNDCNSIPRDEQKSSGGYEDEGIDNTKILRRSVLLVLSAVLVADSSDA